ncbi:hypothetical protein [Streptomyces sp. BE308]|nr:hypothetical protein [Streptomyces sp. BE308]
MPLMDFGQKTAFTPTGPNQWLSYFLIVADRVLATTVVAGVTRNLSRS